MTEKQKQYFCPVCGELDLQLKDGVLYCPNCKIFVGKPESFEDTFEAANPIAAAQARAGLNQEDFAPNRGVGILAFLIRWVNGFLLSLYGCLVILYSGFLYISENSEFSMVLVFGVVYLFFGIFFWKLASDLEAREGNAWWMAMAIHFISLALVLSGFLSPVDLVQEEEAANIAPVLTDVFNIFRIAYPVFIIAMLFTLKGKYKFSADKSKE